jgi:quinol monooxygenase YgiN
MLVLAVTWMAKKGKEEQAVKLLRRLAAESRKEPGCRGYVVHRHCDEPRKFLLYEQYRDDDALEDHRSTHHFQQIARGSLLEVADRLEGDLYEIVD